MVGVSCFALYIVSKHAKDTSGAATAEVAAVPATPSAVAERSIAVLPFVDMSEKKDQEYFSDGPL